MTPTPTSEYDADAMPCQRDLGRTEFASTTYTPLDADTELVAWTEPDGSGYTYRQRWTGGLAAAPKIGDLYRVLHDEWKLTDDGVTYERTIHAWEVKA